MSDQFDNRLSARIKDVFGQHVEEYNPADWQRMQAKLGHKPDKKVIVLFPLWAKAASVILLMGLSVFLFNNNYDNYDNQISIADNADIEDKAENDHINADNTLNISQIENTGEKEIPETNQNLTGPEKKENSKVMASKNSFNNNDVNNTDIQYIAGKEDLFSMDSSKVVLADIKNHLNRHRNRISEDISPKDNSKVVLGDIKNHLNRHRDKIRQKDSLGSSKTNPDLYLVHDDLGIAETSDKKHKNIEFGLGLATVSNYSPDTKGSSINMGGGFSADYQLAKKISISTGMYIAKNELGYNNGSGNVIQSLKNADYAADNSLAMIDGNSAQTDVSFMAIDIPLNLKYRLNKVSVSAGVSSLIFLSEKFTTNYNASVTNTTFNSETSRYETNTSVQNYTNEEKSGSFNHFDFAGLLNVSVGYDIPLVSGSIAVEPYVKVPLSNITSRELKMGSGGVMVRYTF
jgi:hypothetical protein